MLAAARGLADFTVVDCGFCLETDEELSFDTLAPRRNGATLAVLDDADLVVAVGSADPDRPAAAGARAGRPARRRDRRARCGWCSTGCGRGVVPGDPPAELGAALERFAGRTPAALLPADTAALDTALATGRLLGESSPGSPLRRALVELAAARGRRARAGRPAPRAAPAMMRRPPTRPRRSVRMQARWR